MKSARTGWKIALALGLAVCVLMATAPEAQAAKRRKIFIVSHFHYDPVWTNSQAGETMRAFSAVHQDLEYALDEPRFKFTLSEIDYLKPYWDAYPGRRQELMDLVRAGRVDFTGGYNEPDEAEVGGEALIRNFIYGKIYKEAEFGGPVRTAAQLDVFGHSVQMPQILRKTGHDYAVFSRGNLTDMRSEFRWLGPDGSSLLTKQRGYGGSASDAMMAFADNSFFDLTDNGLIFSGGDFSEPNRTIGSFLKSIKTREVVSDTLSGFMDAVSSDVEKKEIVAPAISRDMTPLLPGCYTSRIDTKLANRAAENALADAEELAAMASLRGAKYPWAALDKAWRLLLLGQHHDALTGSDSENVNLDLLTGWREALDLATEVRDASLDYLVSKGDGRQSGEAASEGTRRLAIYNSLNWPRTEPVEYEANWPKGVADFALKAPEGRQIPYQILSESKNAAGLTTWARIVFMAENVPAMGYRVYELADGAASEVSPRAVESDKTAVSSDQYSLEVDPARGGGIVSLVDRFTCKEYLNPEAGVGNEFYSAKENAEKREGPWSVYTTGQVWRSGDFPARVRAEEGPVFSRLIVESDSVRDKAKIYNGADQVVRAEEQEVLPRRVQEIIVYRNYPRIDFKTHILDYKETDYLFKVGFPANIRGAVPVFEERFAAIGRDRNTEDFLEYRFWREPGDKEGREYPAMNWVDMTSTTALNFVGASGEVATNFPLAIGELVTPSGKSAQTIANELAQAFVRKGVTTTPTRHDRERTNEYYGFRLSFGVKGENAYTERLLQGVDEARRSRFDAAVSENGSAYLFVQPEDSVTFTSDRKKIPVLILEAKDETALEKAASDLAGELESRGGIHLADEANAAGIEGASENAGLALLNNGQPGASVENNGVMTLTLMRSSTGWPSGNLYSRNLETENWNHRYRYALYPHTGDWAAAKTYRQGWDFNRPLIVSETTAGAGARAAEESGEGFIEIEGADVVLSALKRGGFPFIDGKRPGVESGPGQLALRLYNPTGFATEGSVKVAAPLAKAERTDMLERALEAIPVADGRFPIKLGPFAIETYILEIGDGASGMAGPAAGVPLGREREVADPFPARYWETNHNAAPMGFEPVSISIEPGPLEPEKGVMTIFVTVANDMKDQSWEGDVEYRLPEGASATGDSRFSLEPGAFETRTVRIEGLAIAQLKSEYIAARVSTPGGRLEDALAFADWKTHLGDVEGAQAPEFDDSRWQTVPLARFWSQGPAAKGVAWHRRSVFVPARMGDIQMHFERPAGAEIRVYVNGKEARVERDGLQYQALLSGNLFELGKENQIAIRVDDPTGEGRMWGLAFKGSEPLFSRPILNFESKELSLAPGGSGAIRLKVTNPFAQALDGVAQLASPIETWPEGGAYSLIGIGPAVQNVTLKPGGQETVEFKVDVPPDAMPGPHWAMVKFTFAGETAYSDVVDIKVSAP